MFTLIDGGFNIFIEDLIDLDLSWKIMFITMVIFNVSMIIRRVNIWSHTIKKAGEIKAQKKLELRLAKTRKKK